MAKLRTHQAGEDQKTVPRKPRRTVFSEAGEAMVIAFSRHTLLLLCIAILHPGSGQPLLHRCFQGNGTLQLLHMEGDKPECQRLNRDPVGFFHLDITEIKTAWRL